MDGSPGDLLRALSTLMLALSLGTGAWLAATVGYARAKARRRAV